MIPYYHGDFPLWELTGIWGAFWGLFVSSWLLCLGIEVVKTVGLWKLFEKAGEEGWAAIIPFYRDYIYSKISTGSGWWMFTIFIPWAGYLFFSIFTSVKMARAFGKSGGYAVGLIFLKTIFICILGFSKNAVYYGPDGEGFGFGGTGYNPNGYNPNGQQGYQNPYSNGNNAYSDTNNGYQNPYQQSNSGYHYYNSQQGTYNQENNSEQSRADTQSQGNKICPNCGQSVPESAKFCTRCGKSL